MYYLCVDMEGHVDGGRVLTGRHREGMRDRSEGDWEGRPRYPDVEGDSGVVRRRDTVRDTRPVSRVGLVRGICYESDVIKSAGPVRVPPVSHSGSDPESETSGLHEVPFTLPVD